MVYALNQGTGNARLFDFEKDLGLKGIDYQLCVSLLFVTYVTFEFPILIMLKKIGPINFIPAAAMSWGAVSLCTAFVQNKSQFVAVWVLLGLFEAGFFPAITFCWAFEYSFSSLHQQSQDPVVVF